MSMWSKSTMGTKVEIIKKYAHLSVLKLFFSFEKEDKFRILSTPGGVRWLQLDRVKTKDFLMFNLRGENAPI